MTQPAPEPIPTISRGAALQAACKFRQLFSKHFVRWETCGWVRREVREGPLELVHLAVPARPPAGSPTDNVLWERSAQLLAQGTLAPQILPSGALSAPEPEAVLIELRMGNWLHKLVRTTSEAWGARLVEHTGPPTFWKVLLHRLGRAGTLRLSHGVPCVIDRSGPVTRLEPIPCRDEKLFFKLGADQLEDAGLSLCLAQRRAHQRMDAGNARGVVPAGREGLCQPHPAGPVGQR